MHQWQPTAMQGTKCLAHTLKNAQGRNLFSLEKCLGLVPLNVIVVHTAWYKGLAVLFVVPLRALPLGVNWALVSGGVRDLRWRIALGRLPVQEILHWHGC